MKTVDIYLDHPRAGFGWRRVIQIMQGPKWTSLFDPATLFHFKLPTGSQAVKLAKDRGAVDEAALRRRIKARRRAGFTDNAPTATKEAFQV